LADPINLESTTLPAARTSAHTGQSPLECTLQIISGSATGVGISKRPGGQIDDFGVNPDVQSAGRSEWITLDVNKFVLERLNVKAPPPQVPISTILFSVEANERVREVFTMHASSILGPSLARKALIIAAMLFSVGCGTNGEREGADHDTDHDMQCIALGVCGCPAPPCITETVAHGDTTVVAPSSSLPPEVVSQLAHNNLDIIMFEDRLFFAFRTAPNHFASPETTLYVVSTTDHQTWRFEGIFNEEADLREPRFMVFEGRLTLFYARLGIDPLGFEPGLTRRTHYRGPGVWSTPETVFEPGFIPWRIKHRDGQAYLIGYTGGEFIYSGEEGELQVRWLRSDDGDTWTPVTGDGIILRGGLSETDFAFLESGAVVTVGRNEAGDEGGFGSRVCRAEAGAYDRWRCADDLRKFDSPHVFRQGQSVYLIGRRNVTETGYFDLGGEGTLPQRRLANLADYWVQPKRCALWNVDVETLEVNHLLDFPTAGDTCFASTVKVGTHQRLMYDYTSPPESPDTVWMDGQHGPTMIYRTTLVFPSEGVR